MSLTDGSFIGPSSGPRPKDSFDDLIDQPLALQLVEHLRRGAAELPGQLAHFPAQTFGLQLVQARQVEPLDELTVDLRLELLKAECLFALGGFPGTGRRTGHGA